MSDKGTIEIIVRVWRHGEDEYVKPGEQTAMLMGNMYTLQRTFNPTAVATMVALALNDFNANVLKKREEELSTTEDQG